MVVTSSTRRMCWPFILEDEAQDSAKTEPSAENTEETIELAENDSAEIVGADEENE